MLKRQSQRSLSIPSRNYVFWKEAVTVSLWKTFPASLGPRFRFVRCKVVLKLRNTKAPL